MPGNRGMVFHHLCCFIRRRKFMDQKASDEKYLQTLVAILIVALCLIGCFHVCLKAVREKSDLKEVLKVGSDAGLSGSAIYYVPMIADAVNTEQAQRELVSRCENCPSVKEVYPRYSFSIFTGIQKYIPEEAKRYMLDGHIPVEDYRKMSEESWFLESDDASLALASVFCGKDGALRYPITLSDGTVRRSLLPNQILLGEDAKEKYKTGDKIWVVRMDEDNFYSFFSCEVIGFIPEEKPLLAVGAQGDPAELKSLLSSISDERKIENSLFDGQVSTYYGVVSSMTDENGHKSAWSYMSDMIIIPEEGYDENDLKNDLQGILLAPERTVPYDSIEQDYKELIEKESERLNTRIIIAVSASAVIRLGTSIYLIMQKKKSHENA